MIVDSSSRLIITAASRSYGSSLLALLGSLNLNWPDHPPILVYDIGLDGDTLSELASAEIQIKKVPHFCEHWRKHFTWKIWCLNDAPAKDILWVDAGVAVLQPIPEVFNAVERQGYFVVPNYQLLDWEASEAACRGCGVLPGFRFGKPTLAGTMMGFRKEGRVKALLEEALAVASVEEYIAATEVTHRHDQAIISLLMYKYFSQVTISDGLIYLGWLSPRQVPGQKVWVHRRKMLEEDQQYLRKHIRKPGPPFMPNEPHQERNSSVYLRLRQLGARIVSPVRRLLGRKKHVDVRRLPYDGNRD